MKNMSREEIILEEKRLSQGGRDSEKLEDNTEISKYRKEIKFTNIDGIDEEESAVIKYGSPHLIDRKLQKDFCELLEMLNMDGSGYSNRDNVNRLKDNGYKDNLFEIHPFNWEDNSKVPNFNFNNGEIVISWYKYPLRGAYCNVELTLEKIEMMKQTIIESGNYTENLERIEKNKRERELRENSSNSRSLRETMKYVFAGAPYGLGPKNKETLFESINDRDFKILKEIYNMLKDEFTSESDIRKEIVKLLANCNGELTINNSKYRKVNILIGSLDGTDVKQFAQINEAIDTVYNEERLKYVFDIKSLEEVSAQSENIKDIEINNIDYKADNKLDVINEDNSTNINHNIESDKSNNINNLEEEHSEDQQSLLTSMLTNNMLTRIKRILGSSYYDWFKYIQYIQEIKSKDLIEEHDKKFSKDSNNKISDSIIEEIVGGFTRPTRTITSKINIDDFKTISKESRLEIAKNILNKEFKRFTNDELKLTKVEDKLHVGIRTGNKVSIPLDILLFDIKGDKYLYRNRELILINEIQYEVYELISNMNLDGTIQCLDKYSYDSIIGWCRRNKVKHLDNYIINLSDYITKIYDKWFVEDKMDYEFVLLTSNYGEVSLDDITSIPSINTRLV